MVMGAAYAMRLHWWWSVAYCIALIIAPLVWIFWVIRVLYAQRFHLLSTAVKLVMFTGILHDIFKNYR